MTHSDYWKTTPLAQIKTVPRAFTNAFEEISESGWDAGRKNLIKQIDSILRRNLTADRKIETIEAILEQADKQ